MLPTPASLSQRLAISWPTDWSLCFCVCAGHRDEIVSELTGKKSSASTVRDAVGGCSDLLALCLLLPASSYLLCCSRGTCMHWSHLASRGLQSAGELRFPGQPAANARKQDQLH